MKRLLILAVALAGAVALIGLPLYVFPAHDEPRAVDAVYVIGPPTAPRIELAEQMIADGLTDTMVVSLGEWDQERDKWPEAAAVCDSAQTYEVLCTEPDPFTTRGEARWLHSLVEDEGWESVAVITTTPHLTRTRVIMERCWDGDIAYLSSGEHLDPWYWAYHYAYQSAAFVKVWLEDGC
ncbi:ElyC/SanA/YdcF family protein [Demequina silvatica]|uniref:ElyC/SanA/YdcF family protein n=1 Tax=Demequina silvatica TaxID=1638988 RepID=UPI0007839439|nr:ElyC/SanA/YdcF family protein [Demequina silvatica]